MKFEAKKINMSSWKQQATKQSQQIKSTLEKSAVIGAIETRLVSAVEFTAHKKPKPKQNLNISSLMDYSHGLVAHSAWVPPCSTELII